MFAHVCMLQTKRVFLFYIIGGILIGGRRIRDYFQVVHATRYFTREERNGAETSSLSQLRSADPRERRQEIHVV